MKTDYIPVSSQIILRNPYCVPAIDASHDLRDSVLRWNGDQHVHMIHHDMPPVSCHADCPLFTPFFWPGQCSWRGGRSPHFIFQNAQKRINSSLNPFFRDIRLMLFPPASGLGFHSVSLFFPFPSLI